MPLLRPPVCCRLHDDLRGQVRAGAGRDPEPTAVIDWQSVRGAGAVPRRPGTGDLAGSAAASGTALSMPWA
jgi:hypothetical protein